MDSVKSSPRKGKGKNHSSVSSTPMLPKISNRQESVSASGSPLKANIVHSLIDKVQQLEVRVNQLSNKRPVYAEEITIDSSDLERVAMPVFLESPYLTPFQLERLTATLMLVYPGWPLSLLYGLANDAVWSELELSCMQKSNLEVN